MLFELSFPLFRTNVYIVALWRVIRFLLIILLFSVGYDEL